MKFDDGVEVDTSGHYRALHLQDGWYMVGHGTLEACSDEIAVHRLIKRQLTPTRELLQEAIIWSVVLEEENTLEHRRQFDQWLIRSPAHIHAYLLIQTHEGTQ